MKHVSLLIPEGNSSLSNLEATWKMFTMANSHFESAGMRPAFKVNLVSATLESKCSSGIFSIQPDSTIDDIKKTDLIVIPAIHGDFAKIIASNQKLIPWITEQYKNGAEVASLCVGAFLLASTGLLDHKSCATHWHAIETFRTMFPKVNVVDTKIVTDENGIYTSGGAYSSLNLNLYLIEKFAGREMAIQASKLFQIDIGRSSQSPFIIFKGQKDHADEAVKQAQEYMENNYQQKIAVDDLCQKFYVGRRTFERRFKKATANTIVEYLQRVKIEVAKKELESGRKTVNEVMYEVGYADSKAFRDIFKKVTGMSANDYKNKFNRSAG